MKIKTLALAVTLAALSPLAGPAAVLTSTTAVHTKPDESSPAVTFLKAGTEPVALPDGVASTPAGWMAVELPGPHTAYVQNKDLAKSLDVVPGASIYLGPKLDSGVLTVAVAGDKTTITGLHGKWTQLTLEKKLVGYINIGGAAGYLPPIATAPAIEATPGAPAARPAPMAPAPVAPAAYGVTTAGQAAPMLNLGDGGSASLPRSFQGKFVTTRRAFMPRRPYDWALTDDAGKRYAYVDVSKLLQTEQIEKYANLMVVVYGTAKPSPDGGDMVIQIESLQLK